jgi:hypothetical protein
MNCMYLHEGHCTLRLNHSRASCSLAVEHDEGLLVDCSANDEDLE